MPKIGALLKEKALTIEFPGAAPEDFVHVRYDPAKYSPEHEAQVKALTDEDENFKAGFLVNILAPGKLLLSWDLQDDEGATIPLETEEMVKVPVGILFAIVNGITDDLLPNQPKPKRSGSFVR